MAGFAISNLDMNGLTILKVRAETLSADPSTNLGEGRWYWNTVTKRIRVYDGAAFLEFGTVQTFAAGSLSPLFTTTVSTATTTPSLSFALTSQAQNLSFMGPASGGPGAPSFRAIVQADLPSAVPVSYWGAATTALNLGSQKITNLADPTNPQDAATKSYVDLMVQGLDVKSEVRVATTANGTLASSFANGSTIDGVTLVTGDRILIKNQTAPAENGVYVVAASGAPARAADFDTWGEFPGAFFFVMLGTQNADSGWVCTSDPGGTLGTTAVTFVQFSGAGQIVAGSGMTKTGNQLDIAAADDSIQVNADSIQVKVDNSTIEVGAGVGLRVKNYAVVSGFDVAKVKLFSGITLANGPNSLTHGLGKQHVIAWIFDSSNRWIPIVDYVATSTTAITIQNDGTTITTNILIIG